MLAKPEYSSPPDEVCCQQRRCGEAVAGRGPSAQRTAGRGAAAKSHREDAAGREWEAGTATSSGKASKLPEGMHHREDAAGQESLGRVAGRGSDGRPWEAGTATSTSKESNLPEGSTIGKQARKEPPRQAGKEHPVLQANKKESGKTHSLLSPLL